MKFIGIVGYKESGKDAVLACIRDLYPNKSILRLNFADEVKREVADALHITVDELEKHKKKYRTLLQVWGTDVRREIAGADYWVLKWGNVLLRHTEHIDLCVATDVRFKNEAELIRTLDGIIIRVTRQGKVSDGHASETEQDKIRHDILIKNNGTLRQLLIETKLKLNHGLYTLK